MVFYALLFGLSATSVIIFLGLLYQKYSSRARRRLKTESKPEIVLTQKEKPKEYLPSALVEKCEEKLGIHRSGTKVKELKKTLVQAGIYSDRAVSMFFGAKLGLALGLPILSMPLILGKVLPGALKAPVIMGLLAVGYFFPTFILNRLVEARQKKITEGLPDALDLLVVCVEAGQGLNAALKRVAEDLKLSNPALSKELGLVNLEINAGLERETALRNLAERTGVEDVSSLCSMLIQSDRFGTSMAQALKVQSEMLRTTRRQRLEELAAKTPVKLVFPLLLFIFPALMVVIIGPAAIRIMENLK
ncbi:MAG: type II secretion system F family protein [Deltaproteobacteria bacterium]|nr:type II secretion system F family protein [Deltaproteobacteria bacterium]